MVYLAFAAPKLRFDSEPIPLDDALTILGRSFTFLIDFENGYQRSIFERILGFGIDEQKIIPIDYIQNGRFKKEDVIVLIKMTPPAQNYPYFEYQDEQSQHYRPAPPQEITCYKLTVG